MKSIHASSNELFIAICKVLWEKEKLIDFIGNLMMPESNNKKRKKRGKGLASFLGKIMGLS